MSEPFHFSDADLLEPIFIDPPDDIGREGAWDGPYAFLLGGMGDPTLAELARQYFDAANQLMDNIVDQRVEDYTISMPVLYLYRHAIELILKAAMGGGDGHELDKLANKFAERIKERYNQKVPEWLLKRLYEVAEIDPRSTSFRYAVKVRPRKGAPVGLGGEHYIDFHHLRRSMSALFSVLERVASAPPPR